jgi:hypothetical protein
MTNRYIVGTRDTEGTYRAVRVDAETISDAKQIAVRRCEDSGVYAVAISAKRINALGLTA